MRSLLLIVLLALGGCAGSAAAPDGTPAPTPASFVQKAAEARSGVIDFAVADLQEASRLAHNAEDVIAYTCWDYLVTVVPETQDSSNGRLDGIATAFQRSRNVLKRVGDGVSTELRLNCGPLYLDAKDDVTGIAGRIGTLAAKLGVKLL